MSDFGFSHLLELLVDGLRTRPGAIVATDEAPNTGSAEVGPPEEDDIGITRFGAWAGLASMVSPAMVARDVAFASSLGLTALHVIVNDDSDQRHEIPFRTYPLAEIRRLCGEAREAGLAVHLLSWILPFESYVQRAADVLIPLALEFGGSVVFDAEEPWTQSRGDRARAASLVGTLFRSVPTGVTGIGYADVEKLDPLVDAVDMMIPQCYATSSSHVDPALAVPRLAGRWRRVFGQTPIIAGLAAYRQRGIPGYTPEAAMRAAFAGAAADPKIHEVVWWALGDLRGNATAARVIRSITHGERDR